MTSKFAEIVPRPHLQGHSVHDRVIRQCEHEACRPKRLADGACPIGPPPASCETRAEAGLPRRILAAWWRHDPNVKMRAVGSHPGLRLVNAVLSRRPGWTKLAARQACPLDGVFAFLGPLLGRAALIVECDDPLGGSAQVGYNEPDARVQLTRMPLDLGDDAAGFVPGRGLIAEAGMIPANIIGRPADGAFQQMGDAALQHLVCGEPDGVAEVLGFEKLVDFG